jgi:hypothetical protein
MQAVFGFDSGNNIYSKLFGVIRMTPNGGW